MNRGQAHLQLDIELGSEPIAGSYASGDGAAHPFSGWIELAAAIETARSGASAVALAAGEDASLGAAGLL